MERLTKQRSYILEAVKSMGHASFNDINEYLKENDAHLSIATLYRNLKSLTEDNILRTVDTTSVEVLYEVVKDNPIHDHFICKCCGNVIDIPKKEENGYIDNMGNKIEDEHINYYGICSKCLSKVNKGH